MSEPRRGIARVWLLAGIVVIPLLSLLASATQPSRDAIISFLFEMIILGLYAVPALFRYRGNGRWLAMDVLRHPWRTYLSILIYVPPAAVLLGVLIHDLMQGLAYDYSDLIVTIPLAIWCLALRAAMAAPRVVDEATNDEATA